MTPYQSLNRLRVVAVLEEARWGGPQKRSVDIAEALKPEVNTLIILPRGQNDRFLQELNDRELPFATIELATRQRNIFAMIHFLLMFPRDVLRLRKCIVQFNADVVHANGGANWRAQFAAKLAGVPVIWHLIETRLDSLSLFGFKIFWRLADGFISASRRSEGYYLKGRNIGKRARFCFAEPVNCASFFPKTKAAHSNIRVGLVGNINPDKDILNFVRSAKIVFDAKPDFGEFLVAGAKYSSRRDYIEQVERENAPNATGEARVEFLGPSNKIAAFLNSLDIYVCSSAFESSPISVWEALACGLPVVATDVGDIKQMNEKGEFAIVVPTNNPEALANAVLHLAQSPKLRAKLAANARKFASSELDVSICAKRHLEVYRMVAKAEA